MPPNSRREVIQSKRLNQRDREKEQLQEVSALVKRENRKYSSRAGCLGEGNRSGEELERRRMIGKKKRNEGADGCNASSHEEVNRDGSTDITETKPDITETKPMELMVKLILLNEKDDVEAYLTTFERIMEAHKIPKE